METYPTLPTLEYADADKRLDGIGGPWTQEKSDIIPEGVDVLAVPLSELPPIGDYSSPNKPFEVRRQLRPEGEGSNFHNMPVFHFGMWYDRENNNAIITVPTAEYLNKIAEMYNPGGFTFESTGGQKGVDTADEFLTRLSHKKYPLSNDMEIDDAALPDKYNAFLAGGEDKPGVFPSRGTMSPYEHDRIDHMGIIALSEGEADKIASFAANSLEKGTDSSKQYATGCLDRIMDLISAYAIADDIYKVEDRKSYKDFIWGQIMSAQVAVSELVGGQRKPFEYYDGYLPVWEVRARTHERAKKRGLWLELDREAIDKSIAAMREIPA